MCIAGKFPVTIHSLFSMWKWYGNGCNQAGDVEESGIIYSYISLFFLCGNVWWKVCGRMCDAMCYGGWYGLLCAVMTRGGPVRNVWGMWG